MVENKVAETETEAEKERVCRLYKKFSATLFSTTIYASFSSTKNNLCRICVREKWRGVMMCVRERSADLCVREASGV